MLHGLQNFKTKFKTKIKITLALLVLVSVIASIIHPDYFALIVFFAYTPLLTVFGLGHNPFFYTQTKENKYITSKGVRDLLRLIAYFIYPILFIIVSLLIFHVAALTFSAMYLSLFGEYTLPSWEANSQEPSVFWGILLFVSGAAFIFTVDFLNKLANREEKIVIGVDANE